MTDSDDDLEKVASAFNRETDPLAQFETQFRQLDVDPLEAFLDRIQVPNGATQSTLDNYRYSFDQWRSFMDASGRHFACPNDTHVKQFVTHLRRNRENGVSTVKKKVNNLNRAYRWWQNHQAFPHPTDYNPFQIAIQETNMNDGPSNEKHPPVSLSELRSVIANCQNVRKRLFIIWMVKLGLRVGELLNIQLQDIALSHPDLNQWYPELGSADPVQGYEDAIYVPSKFERPGNKSNRPRVLPLDDELKRVFMQYIPTRVTVDSPYLILSQRTYEKMNRGDRVNQVWKTQFSEFNESDQYRDITSHYGRYYFTNYWKVDQDVPRELVQYMRGDKLGDYSGESIDEYLTAYYDDIKELYLNRIFKVLH